MDPRLPPTTPALPSLSPRPRGLTPLALLAIAAGLWATPIRWEWDTQQLYDGLSNLIAWAGRGFDGRAEAGPFPPFQYLLGLPVVLLNRAGVPINVFWVWATCSLLSLAGTAWLLCRGGRTYGSPAVGWLLVVVLLSGPLVTYAPSTFNELPAALMTALSAFVVVGRGGAVMSAMLFVAAGLTKEIAAPLLALIWLAGLSLRTAELGRAGLARHASAMAVAAIVTLALHAGFNEIRYGSPWNLHYLTPPHLTRPWPRRFQNVAALWLSPNGGVVAFWPTLVIPLIVAFVGVRGARSPARMAVACVALLLAILTLGLSAFYQPFGWWCWGPRLMLPWLPACLIVLVRACPDGLRAVAQAGLATPRRFAATAIITCACAVPHLAMLANPTAMTAFFHPDPQFPRGASPDEPELHYARQVFLAWRKWPPLLVWPMRQPPTAMQVAAAGAYLAGLIGLLAQARSALTEPVPAADFSPKIAPGGISC